MNYLTVHMGASLYQPTTVNQGIGWVSSDIMNKVGIIDYLSSDPGRETLQRRAHRNPPAYIHPPIFGMIYPISTYIFN